MESHSGNASDQITMPTAAVKINKFCRELKNAPDFIYVGDSAIYANIIQHSADSGGEFSWRTGMAAKRKVFLKKDLYIKIKSSGISKQKNI